ncbi:MAG: DUF1254 domain-containing protein [Alphaproteobacteria bacterium]|nr:DUF1254 domain-containing protein [Alphaproteobacteria bacterium]
MMRWIGWAAFTLALAAAIHWAAITYAPSLIMARAMTAMGGKGVNTITHGDRATAASRTIVKPSPDLLYSYCVFDVSRQPLKITTAAPTDTYWSVALYTANTDNFYTLNDTQAGGQPATIVLVGQGQTVPPQPEGTIIVAAPSQKGVVLFRTLINDDAREPELDRMRRAAACDPLR